MLVHRYDVLLWVSAYEAAAAVPSTDATTDTGAATPTYNCLRPVVAPHGASSRCEHLSPTALPRARFAPSLCPAYGGRVLRLSGTGAAGGAAGTASANVPDRHRELVCCCCDKRHGQVPHSQDAVVQWVGAEFGAGAAGLPVPNVVGEPTKYFQPDPGYATDRLSPVDGVPASATALVTFGPRTVIPEGCKIKLFVEDHRDSAIECVRRGCG